MNHQPITFSLLTAGALALAAFATPSATAQTTDGPPTSQPSATQDGHTHQGLGFGDTPPDLDDGASAHYGNPFSIEGAPISLADAIATCSNTGEVCKVEGTIDSVCQVRGCWFTLSAPDVDPIVRIRMQDYAFFVPRNAIGATVVLEGTLERTVIPQDLAQHFADDEANAGTAPAREVAGPEDTFQFMISGAQIQR